MRNAGHQALLREELLFEADGWTFPPSEWEAQIVRELHDMQGYAIPRLPDAELQELELQPNACHANALWCERNDVRGGTKAVTGWWLQGMEFILHSVVHYGGDYCCVTPSRRGDSELLFYPDPLIEWVDGDGTRVAMRNGQAIGLGVRRFPAFTIAQRELVRMRLRIGMTPDQASTFSRREIERLLARHLAPEERALVGEY